jgi:hypothetical protein
MVRARLFSIDSAFEKTSFFGSILFLVFDLICFLPQKSSVANRKLEKERYPQKGGGTRT